MRVAVMIIALCLVMIVGLQSCAVGVGSTILGDEATSDAAKFGVLLAFLFVVGAALVWKFPHASAAIFLLGGGLAIALGTSGEYNDLAVWGGVSVALGLMALSGHRELRPMPAQAPSVSTVDHYSAEPLEDHKPGYLSPIIVVAITAVATAAYLASQNQPAERPEEQSAPAAAPPVLEPGIAVTAHDLAAAYAANEVAAQLKYGNQTLDVTGEVDSVTLDASDQPVLVLSTGNVLFDIMHSVRAQFDASWSQQLAVMNPGDTITIRCAKVSEIMGAAFLDKCLVPEQPASENDNAEFDASETTGELDGQVAAEPVTDSSAEAPMDTPQVTARWLVGTWGPIRPDTPQNRLGVCDKETMVRFQATGEYRDSGSYGRFKTDGASITYYNRILYDEAEDTRDTSQYGVPLITPISTVGPYNLLAGGVLFYRCQE